MQARSVWGSHPGRCGPSQDVDIPCVCQPMPPPCASKTHAAWWRILIGSCSTKPSTCRIRRPNSYAHLSGRNRQAQLQARQWCHLAASAAGASAAAGATTSLTTLASASTPRRSLAPEARPISTALARVLALTQYNQRQQQQLPAGGKTPCWATIKALWQRLRYLQRREVQRLRAKASKDLADARQRRITERKGARLVPVKMGACCGPPA
jgi:hypothetical protein